MTRTDRLSGTDAQAYAEIRREALANHPDAYGSALSDWQGRTLSDVANMLDSASTVGVFTGEKLLGVATLLTERGAHQRHLGMVYAVYVRPVARGTGAFGTLMDAIEDLAREMGLLQLVLHAGQHNARALAAYTRQGYEVTGIIPRALLVGNRFFDEVVLVKALDA